MTFEALLLSLKASKSYKSFKKNQKTGLFHLSLSDKRHDKGKYDNFYKIRLFE
jgi:hypothetical protein